jgi:N-methylhydantoinase A
VAQLDRRLAGAGITTRQKYIMQSNGGMATFAAASRRAVTTGAVGAGGRRYRRARLACRSSGFPNIITFDMGGTSCDVALIRDGEPLLSGRGKDRRTRPRRSDARHQYVSAGGGTIAEVDRFGVLQVGPAQRGRGAGPAVLRRGGEAPTITDCNLALGLSERG